MQGAEARLEKERLAMSENGGIGHIFSRVDLNWRRDGEAWVVRYRNRALLHVVPDATYPAMWRIRHLDGRLSGIVNLSRAKDAAISLALGILNGDKRRAVASPMRESESAATPGALRTRTSSGAGRMTEIGNILVVRKTRHGPFPIGLEDDSAELGDHQL
jgi:hypothetical protein